MQDDISISRLQVGPEEEALVLDVLRSGHLVQGAMVERLERSFIDVTGARHAVAVSNGTIALVAALQAVGSRAGRRSHHQSVHVRRDRERILEAGATRSFRRHPLDDFTIDAEAVPAVISDRTRVLMPVHLYGQAADCDALSAIADRNGLALVEDAAQAHGATYNGRGVGSFGVGCFSLYGTKNVTTGEGGIVTTDDDAIADRLRLLRNQGMRARYQYEIAGHNYRLTDLQAALAHSAVRDLEATTAKRRRNAAALTNGLQTFRASSRRPCNRAARTCLPPIHGPHH